MRSRKSEVVTKELIALIGFLVAFPLLCYSNFFMDEKEQNERHIWRLGTMLASWLSLYCMYVVS
jgi:fucose 4-O-acetylase-like acetyltransferase